MYKRILLALLIGAVLLGACNLNVPSPTPTVDVFALYTAAAQTVVASVSQTASAPSPPPSATPETAVTQTVAAALTQAASVTIIPTSTAISGLPLEASPTPALCDAADVIADVNIPDGTVMSPGQDFVKTWLVKNIGTCPWGTGYQVIYAQYAVRMDGQPLSFNTPVNPGEQVEISVQFKAPAAPGEYLSAWRMANALGQPFGEIFYVKIVVK